MFYFPTLLLEFLPGTHPDISPSQESHLRDSFWGQVIVNTIISTITKVIENNRKMNEIVFLKVIQNDRDH